ncbi:uncharacterized protein LOC125518620 [Triticum urartu]|uniref:uncharacterized protein LOC125518620 n=1 Tax=Triticum urartu TaxID=4572 RepID=UPI0020442BDB|nr:uncharacterized protein LOC125518620 [Triticum urartu]
MPWHGLDPPGVSLQRLLKPSIKPSLESESIFMPVAPGAVGSNSGAASVGPGTSAGGSGAAAVAPGPGTSEPGPGAMAVSPGTSTMQQVVADSTPPPPNPTALVSVAVMTVNEVEAPSWAHPILNLLVSGELPTDEILAQQVQHRAGAYTIVNRELVRRSVTGVFQRCVESEKGKAILRDIHQGECGHHAASRSLVAKAFCHSFFWPTALEDAKDLVKKCKGCQKFSSKQHLSASALKTTPLTWPFAVWGLDMVDPFKIARGDITVRYSVPHNIITDNGTNFAKGTLARFCVTQSIRLDLAFVSHPQSNGQVERANGLILSGIKP